jgi:ferredoxin-NADP reductase
MAVTRKIRCRVERIEPAGEHVYNVELIPDDLLPRFKPGQFLHLALDEYDPSSYWPDSRIFSIASSPSNRERLLISYSVRGRFTARMEKELAEGNNVWVKLPYGDFIIDERKDIVLIAGGTGITAFTAFIDSLKPDFSKSIYLVYGVRKREFLLYQDMIMEKLLSVPKMSASYFIEDMDSDVIGSGEGEPGKYKGIITLDRIWQGLENAGNAVFYLSGPPVMLSVLSKGLSLKGIDKNSIRIDAWE